MCNVSKLFIEQKIADQNDERNVHDALLLPGLHHSNDISIKTMRCL